MLSPVTFADGTAPDIIGDFVGLGIAVATFFGMTWAAVKWATRPLRQRLDEIHALAEGLRAERERVDDLSDKVANIERRVATIERRVEDLYHLLLTIIDPRRLRRDDPQHTPPLDEA